MGHPGLELYGRDVNSNPTVPIPAMTRNHEPSRTVDSPDERSLSWGDPVVDGEDDDPSDGIVVLTPDATIAEWEIRVGDEERTIAETNPEYDPDEPVVLVTYEHWLDEAWPEWETANPHELFDGVCDRGVKFYSFPASRLERDPTRTPHGDRGSREATAVSVPEGVGADEESDGERAEPTDPDGPDERAEGSEAGDPLPEDPVWDPPEWMLELEARLAEGASVSIDEKREVMRIEKLGECYAVGTDGEIDGDGALRSRLEPIVDELYEDE